MIFDQKIQSATKRNFSYVAKQIVSFLDKKGAFEPESYPARDLGLQWGKHE